MPFGRVILLSLFVFLVASAQQTDIPLYEGPAPGSEVASWPETQIASSDGLPRVANVTRPTLTVFAPAAGKGNGTGLVVAPGGGFRHLAIAHEGEQVARWLAERGVTVFVLKYRLMRTGDAAASDAAEMVRRRTAAIPLAVADGLQAIRVVRSQATRYGLNPDRIGILGFSAGGWVAAAAALQGRGETRPSFAAPIYAAMPEDLTAPPNPMPLFLVHADDDKTVIPVRTSVRLYESWKKSGASVELHIYSRGAHGFGMKPKNLPSDEWIRQFWAWLQTEGLVR